MTSGGSDVPLLDALWRVDVPFDARWFLEVPAPLRAGARAELTSWVAERIATLPVNAAWTEGPGELALRLEGQARLLSSDAFAAFLYCPRGLPADALVEVFVGASDASELADVPVESSVALPQRTSEVTSATLGTGRAIAAVTAMPDGALVGQLRYQFLSRGVLVEVCATSADLSALGAGMPQFEELASGIVIEIEGGSAA